MKLLKVFGIVVGIHIFALILIFANPGCSSPSQPPATSDTVTKTDNASTASITVPPSNAADASAAPAIDPNSPAITMPVGIRYSPTRPNTAAANVLESQPVNDVTPASTYTVGKGDSLWSIAKKNHITLTDLAAANNLKTGSSVHQGQKLIIPGKSTAASSKTTDSAATKSPASTTVGAISAAPPAASAGTVKHTVKAGETLGAIARKYQVKMGDLATANNIADPAKIRPGMELVIPGWQTPASKSGKSSSKTAAASPPPVIPTIDVSGASSTTPSSNEPPVISVDEAPAPKK